MLRLAHARRFCLRRDGAFSECVGFCDNEARVSTPMCNASHACRVPVRHRKAKLSAGPRARWGDQLSGAGIPMRCNSRCHA